LRAGEPRDRIPLRAIVLRVAPYPAIEAVAAVGLAVLGRPIATTLELLRAAGRGAAADANASRLELHQGGSTGRRRKNSKRCREAP